MNDQVLVFDTGPLCNFAQQNWLGVLKAIVGSRTALVPDVVQEELRAGAASDSRIQAVLEAGWIQAHELRTDEEIQAFDHFSALLVRGRRNVGEAGVLALAATIGGVAVIDDAAGRRAAERHRVALRPTLALLVDGLRAGLLTIPLVSALADDLIAGSYRLPFEAGGFEKWVADNGLLDG